jgi:hypothetical protein
MTARAAHRSWIHALLLVVPVAAAVVVTTAGPSAAAKGSGAGSTRYPGALTFGAGKVAGSFTDGVSGVGLADYTSADYDDRVIVQPGGSQFVQVDRGGGLERCRHDVKSGLSALSVYGEKSTWATMPLGDVMGARVEIQCLTDDGKQHVLHWGNWKNRDGSYDRSRTTNCVDLTRVSTTEFRITTAGEANGCATQDEVINNRVQQLEMTVLDMPFTATITLSGGGPTPVS